MLLTIILTLIFLTVIIIKNISKIRKSRDNSEALVILLYSLEISVAVSLVVSFTISFIVYSTTAWSDSNIEFVMRKEQIVELETLEDDKYIITDTRAGQGGAQCVIKLQINNKERTIKLKNLEIYLAQKENLLVTHTYEYKNNFLNYLLFLNKVKKHLIYTTQTSLEGAYSIYYGGKN